MTSRPFAVVVITDEWSFWQFDSRSRYATEAKAREVALRRLAEPGVMHAGVLSRSELIRVTP